MGPATREGASMRLVRGRLGTAGRSPVTLLLVTGVLALLLIALGTLRVGNRAAADQAVWSAQDKTELLGLTVAEPAVSQALLDGDPGAVDRFDALARRHLLVDDVARVKVWRADGRILYSDLTPLIGTAFPLGPEEQQILADGGTEAEVSDLSAPENALEAGERQLVEVYTRIHGPGGQPLLFETYYNKAIIDRRRNELLGAFWPITFAGMALVLLVATGLLFLLTRRLRRSADERERLLEAAADASAAERVRIARDLHDGVVQDLVGASFAMSALARTDELPSAARRTAEEAGATVRTSLKSLRSLMVEIYPPDLRVEALGAALQDLLAPAAAQGVAASASVVEAEPASDAAVRLVWRVAQEAVRNALRHSGARTLGVTVTGEEQPVGRRLVLTVSDDGTGFDPQEPRSAGHFGLRGLAGLVRDAGGRLDVRSAAGEGTTVHLEVPAGAA